MRKRIVFPATFRGHLARQKLLLEELKKDFDVDIFEPTTPNEKGMSDFSIVVTKEFNNFLAKKKYDCVLIRGDRYEMLGLAMISAYQGIPIAHIEGGDLSGAIDNKVRYAITHLSDYHFCTNEESHQRLIQNGIPTDKVWNFGSLDVEFTKSVEPKKPTGEEYIFVSYHPIEGEDENQVKVAVDEYANIAIQSNKDYGRQYGKEVYSPEDYINLMRDAACLVGNSSSFLKEASILKVPVVLVGDRQKKRLLPMNVITVPCESKTIKQAIEFQTQRKFGVDFTYYKPKTSKEIANKLKEVL